MGNRAGKKYGFTAICPILSNGKDDRVVEVRRLLSELPNGDASPFARLPVTHVARFVVIEDLVYQGYPAYEDHLQSGYLLFNTVFDGELEDYLHVLLSSCGELVQELWQHCAGFPGIHDFESFCRYFKKCQFKTGLFFVDTPDADVPQILRAIQVQQAVVKFVGQNQGLPPGELQQRFEKFLEALHAAPAPRPGQQAGEKA